MRESNQFSLFDPNYVSVNCSTLFSRLHGCVPFYVLASDMGLHYLTFMGRDFEHKKKPTLLQLMDISVGLNNKNVVERVDILVRDLVINSNHRG